MNTLTLNTSVSAPTAWKSIIRTTIGISNYFSPCKSKTDDVLVVNNIQPSIEFNLNEQQLTEQAMNFSMSSFSEEWDKEDDEFWNKF